MALNQDFNLPRLERCLALTWESGAQPVVIFTKSDLRENLDEKLALAAPVTLGVETLVISSIKGDTWKYVRELIRPGMTAAMIGSSGTGKSTLLDRLLGGEAIRTNGLRSDGKGRHTTTRRTADSSSIRRGCVNSECGTARRVLTGDKEYVLLYNKNRDQIKYCLKELRIELER